MDSLITSQHKKSERKKALLQIYLALGFGIAACVSHFFYKDLTFVFLIFNILSSVQILRDKIFEVD